MLAGMLWCLRAIEARFGCGILLCMRMVVAGYFSVGRVLLPSPSDGRKYIVVLSNTLWCSLAFVVLADALLVFAGI